MEEGSIKGEGRVQSYILIVVKMMNGIGDSKRRKRLNRSNPLTSNTDNSERSDSTSSHEQHPQSLTLESIKPILISISLPNQWQAISSAEDIQYCKMDTDLNGLYKVTTSIRIHADLSWSV